VAAACDVGFNCACFLWRRSDDDGAIFLVNLAGQKLLCEFVVRDVIFGGDDAAGGIFVEPVDDAGAKRMPAGRELPAVSEESIHQRMGGIPRRRMYDEASRFIDDDEMLVLKKDVEGDLLRLERRLFAGSKSRSRISF
jgi:hypothetical protein